ncbi:MAG: hypothetical protein GH151_06275 [Bacteroidetes bacterium]|nr:hypothetical protein [Bacteroidota bacterium]
MKPNLLTFTNVLIAMFLAFNAIAQEVPYVLNKENTQIKEISWQINDNGWGWEGPYGHQASYTDRMMQVEDFMVLRVDVTSGDQQASDIYLVLCLDCFGGQLSALIYPNPARDFLNVIIEDTESEIINSTLKSKRKTSKFTNGYSGDIIYTIYNNLSL